jgi:hypothetical protein
MMQTIAGFVIPRKRPGAYPLERAAGAHRVFENRAASGTLILAI